MAKLGFPFWYTFYNLDTDRSRRLLDVVEEILTRKQTHLNGSLC
jgi:hypothetical protein